MNIQPALAAVTELPPDVRRFQLPDIDREGMWLLPRLRKVYPQLTTQTAIGWLRNVIYNNEFYAAWLPNVVGLMQVITPTLKQRPILYEHFVWVKDKEDKALLEQASWLYPHFAQWGKRMNCETMTLDGQSDVPVDLVRERLGRVFTREQVFARL